MRVREVPLTPVRPLSLAPRGATLFLLAPRQGNSLTVRRETRHDWFCRSRWLGVVQSP